MWDNVPQNRKSQRAAAFAAVCILVGLLVMWPVGGETADWLNATWAPTAEADRYVAVADQDTVTFDMDADAFKDTSSCDSAYVWQNASGDVLYSNISHSAGVLSVTTECTEGNATGNITNDLSWTAALPYFRIYFDYTALEAYQDNVVRIRLNLADVDDGGNDKVRTVTFSAGGVTFFTTTIAASDTDSTIDENITVSANELREAIINDGGGETAYFKLIVKGTDNDLSIAGSEMYTYNTSNLVNRDDPLYIFGALTIGVTFLGIVAVQPRTSLPFGKKGVKGGGF